MANRRYNTQVAQPRGTDRVKKAEGGRVNSKRMNRLEELGRVDAEKANTPDGKRNLKDEKKRILKEIKYPKKMRR